MSIKNITIWIIILVFIDQAIKVIIYDYFFDSMFDIVPFLLEFRPVFNSSGTILFNFLHNSLTLNIGVWIAVFYFVCLLCLVIILYILFRKAKNNIKLFDAAFIFAMAGLVSSLISTIFWEGGCLDYIYLKPFFVFDLKDLYLNCFGILFCAFLYKKRIRTFKQLFELAKIKEHI